jgi:hypothetical protein
MKITEENENDLPSSMYSKIVTVDSPDVKFRKWIIELSSERIPFCTATTASFQIAKPENSKSFEIGMPDFLRVKECSKELEYAPFLKIAGV